MSTNNHIQEFSASDIEKYHRGTLSPAEQHRLEKAALDDPFLADALEGYSQPGVQAAPDMQELQTRLAARTENKEDKKIVPLGGGTRMPWLRAAAVIIILGGGGMLAYKGMMNTNKETSVA